MARIMTAEGVSCTYALLTAVSYVMHDVTKVVDWCTIFADIITAFAFTRHSDMKLWCYWLTS